MTKKPELLHCMFGISHMSVRSVGECCCKLSPKATAGSWLDESVFLTAGTSDGLEDKTFHYLSESLFDNLADDELPQQQAANRSTFSAGRQQSADSVERNAGAGGGDFNQEIVMDIRSEEELRRANEDAALRPRDKTGNLDESYGRQRFGAFYMDQFQYTPDANADRLAESAESAATGQPASNLASSSSASSSAATSGLTSAPQTTTIAALSFIFYGLQLNISANLLHQVLMLVDRSQTRPYKKPYSSNAAGLQDTGETAAGAGGDKANEAAAGEVNVDLDSIELMAMQFEKYVAQFSTTVTLKEPAIRFYPYSHFLIPTSRVICMFRLLNIQIRNEMIVLMTETKTGRQLRMLPGAERQVHLLEQHEAVGRAGALQRRLQAHQSEQEAHLRLVCAHADHCRPLAPQLGARRHRHLSRPALSQARAAHSRVLLLRTQLRPSNNDT